MGFILKFLFFAIGFYYLFKFLGRLVLGNLFSQAGHQEHNKANQRKEGIVSVTRAPKDNKKHVSGGDYVDFEEID